ncbi:hypothetical protein [Blastochloris sulfoviridis]|uniref:hypothetical protein n=1 Tax=Blastochloris sulfoviridis TaxID=50712 RepID=UPI001FEC3157|nr:hypothetical protein [Blastochloris sulfoviridis]
MEGLGRLVPRPDTPPLSPRHHPDSDIALVNTMIKALARAHRWRRMLESGEFATVQDLAAAEKINPSYLARVLRLTLLAPDIVEAILDGRQPAGLQLNDLLAPFPVEWERQHDHMLTMRIKEPLVQADHRSLKKPCRSASA